MNSTCGIRWRFCTGAGDGPFAANQFPQSSSPPKSFNIPPVPLRRPSLCPSVGLHRLFPFRLRLYPLLPAGLRLLKERLGHRHRPAHVAQQKHLHLEYPAVVLDLQHVSHADFARGLRRVAIGVDPVQVAGLCRQRPRLKEPRRPQPLVDSYSRFATQCESPSTARDSSPAPGPQPPPASLPDQYASPLPSTLASPHHTTSPCPFPHSACCIVETPRP